LQECKNESQSVVCKGCLKQFKRLHVHLRSKNGSKCKSLYNENDINPEKANRSNTYYQKNKEKILLKRKFHYDKERISDKNKGYYDQNKQNISKRRKCHYEKNKDTIRVVRKEHYDANRKIKLQKIQEKKKNMSLDDCLHVFRREIVWGSIYPCISCHRACFRNGVNIFKISEVENIEKFDEFVDMKFVHINSIFFVKGSFWICHTCKLYIRRNKMPKISKMNALHIYDRPSFLNLTEVENVMIAPRINFIKMIKLPVSRMKGIKDKIINVPIPLETVKKTIHSLPRNLDEASVIPIMVKRKREYLSNVFHQYIRPEIIKKAVTYLCG
jgi:hypothetical protein